MDPLHSSIALGPVALYLIWLGVVNLRRRPTLCFGGWEVTRMSLAFFGLIAVGPAKLFMPEFLLVQLGGYAWLLFAAVYALVAILIIFLARPRMVIYNIKAETLRPMLHAVVARLDSACQTAGDTLVLPQLGAQLHLDEFESMKHVSLNAVGSQQNVAGWRALGATLRQEIQQTSTKRNSRGYVFVVLSVAILTILTWKVTRHPDLIAEQIRTILRL